jgi:hypothetical protein
VVLAVIILVDIFLQILYARANKTLISTPLAKMKEIDPVLARIKKEELGPVYGD